MFISYVNKDISLSISKHATSTIGKVWKSKLNLFYFNDGGGGGGGGGVLEKYKDFSYSRPFWG